MLKTQIPDNATIAGINFLHVGQNIRIVAGLPFRVALVYASLFAVAFWFYSVLWTSAPVMTPDSTSYLRAAQDISDYHIDQLQERAPGYPVLLVLTGSSRSPTRGLFFVSLLLHFLAIWLLASVLYRAGLKEIMLTVFCLLLLLPPYVEPAAYVMSENLTEVMLVSAFVGLVFWWLTKRTISILLSALAIGCAALTRPTYQVLALAMAGYLFTGGFLFHWIRVKWRDVVRGSLILILGSVVTVGGCVLFNYQNFGYLGVTPKFGLTLNTKTWRFLERLPAEDAAIRDVLIKARNAKLLEEGGLHEGSMSIWDAVPELTNMTGLQFSQLSDYMLHKNLFLIKRAPLQYLLDVVWAFGLYWFPSSGELANLNSQPVQLLWAVIHFCLIGAFAFNLILLVGAATYIKTCKTFRTLTNSVPISAFGLMQLQTFMYGLAGLIVIYTAAISCLIEVGVPRYRVPTDGLIVFMLFLGMHLWRRLVNLSKAVVCQAKDVSCEPGQRLGSFS